MCHTWSVCSVIGMRTFSWRASGESKRQRSTEAADSEKIAKFTPLPSQVAPRGYGYPSQTFTGVIEDEGVYPILERGKQETLTIRRPERGTDPLVDQKSRSCSLGRRNPAVESRGRSPSPARLQPTSKSALICSAKMPTPRIRLLKRGSFNRPPPRRCLIRPSTFSLRSGKCSASQRSKSGATANGSLTTV